MFWHETCESVKDNSIATESQEECNSFSGVVAEPLDAPFLHSTVEHLMGLSTSAVAKWAHFVLYLILFSCLTSLFLGFIIPLDVKSNCLHATKFNVGYVATECSLPS